MTPRYPAAALLVLAAACADVPALPEPLPAAALNPAAACLALPLGGARALAAESASGTCLAADSAGAEYALVVGNGQQTVPLAVTVQADGVQESAGPVRVAARAKAASPLPAPDLPGEEEARMLESLGRLPGARLAAAPAVAPPAIGTLLSYNVANGCPESSRDMRAGRVVAVTPRVIVVSDTASPAGGFAPLHWTSIAAEFDTLAYPVVASHFGIPTDVDGNGRIVAFYTRAVNELTAPGATSYTGGFIRNRDLLARTVCRASNQAEVVFMLVPDPLGTVNGHVRTPYTVRRQTVGLLAHELQHVVNVGARVYHPQGQAPYEVSWLNEGLSHVAEELVFYRAAGLRPGRNIDQNHLRPKRAQDALERYQLNNLLRLQIWMGHPEAAQQGGGAEGRASTWSFLRYAADRRGGNHADFWKSLVNSRLTGRANLAAAIRADPQVWWREWLVASLVDDAVRGVTATHRIPSWNLQALLGSPYPLVPRRLSDGQPLEVNLAATGAAYFGFTLGPSSTGTLTLSAAGGALPAETRVVVVRVR